ncbi:alpha/beta hydrolase [Streptomyces sp. B1866]|uniref:alpha/beta hydrolase n=1 Tax=Streptomyces sp. B1866 TaxID=3075431 RepID=UPI0028910201|nr:alpha/beta hydrolase [Streptomyces sp. B1866]MDT3396495.1 alpha/beta hydrolase [Streptomyces sp. B1866]
MDFRRTFRTARVDTGTGAAGPASRRTALRRIGLAAGGAALAAGAGAGTARAAERRGAGPRTYVLVHGTHSSGAFWMPIARELTLRGHRVVTVDQPMHGAEAFVPVAYQTQDLAALATEPSPLRDLTLDDYEKRVTDTVRRAARHGGPVVLVGHSLGGASVSRVADAVPGLLAHICYMAAFCPSPAMPSPDACTAAPENADALIPYEQMVGDQEKLRVLRLNPRSGAVKDLAAYKAMMCADYPDPAFRLALSGLQTDEPIGAYAGQAVGRPDTWGRLPRTYLRFGKDRTIATRLQDRMIAEADERTPDNPFRVVDFPDAPHIGPLDPAAVTDALARLGR